MEPPPCVQNAMMKQTKKPFTYTPGGLDLSEIKSPRMARRIERNANYTGEPEPPRPSPHPQNHGPLPPSALAAMQPQLQVQVFPSGAPPPPKGGVPPPPPPPVHHHAPPPPPMCPLPTQKVMTADNQVLERPDMTKIIPDNPMQLLRKTGGPQPRKSFVEEMFNHSQPAQQPPSPPHRQQQPQPQYSPPVQQQQQQWSPPPKQQPPQHRWSPPPPASPPTQQQPPAQMYHPNVIERQPPRAVEQPVKTSTAHLGSLYIPPANQKQQQQQRGPQTPPTPPQRDVQSPGAQSPSTPTLKEAPKPWQKQKESQELPPWAKREPAQSPEHIQVVQQVSPPVQAKQPPQPQPQQQKLAQARPQGYQNNHQPQRQQYQPAQPQPLSSPEPQAHPNAVFITQPMVFQHPGPRQPASPKVDVQGARVIKVEGARPNNAPTTPGANDRSLNRQQSWGNNPTQSNSFKLIQKITNTDGDDDDEDDQPIIEHAPKYPQQFQQMPVAEQMRKMKFSEGDRELMNRFKQGVDDETYLHNEVDPRYRGPAIPSKAFKLLQSMTDGSPSGTPESAAATPATVSRGSPSAGNRTPQVRTIPIQIERDDPPQPYVHPSQQTVPEPKKYTGSSIPSRSFKILQAMTAPDSCANANEVNENCDPSSYWGCYYDPSYPYPYHPSTDYYYAPPYYYPPQNIPPKHEEGVDRERERAMARTPLPWHPPQPWGVPYYPPRPQHPPPSPYPFTPKSKPSEVESDCDSTARSTPLPFWGYYPPPPPPLPPQYYPPPTPTPKEAHEMRSKPEDPYWDPYYYYYAAYPPLYSPYPFYGGLNSDSEEAAGYSSTDEMAYYGKKLAEEAAAKEAKRRSEKTPTNIQRAPVEILNDSETEDSTETEADEEEGNTPTPTPKHQTKNGLQAIKSVKDISIYDNDEYEEVEPPDVEEHSTSTEENDDDDSAIVYVIEDETIPHQLSVIFEVSERTDTSKRAESVLSDCTTIADEDYDIAITYENISLPYNLEDYSLPPITHTAYKQTEEIVQEDASRMTLTKCEKYESNPAIQRDFPSKLTVNNVEEYNRNISNYKQFKEVDATKAMVQNKFDKEPSKRPSLPSSLERDSKEAASKFVTKVKEEQCLSAAEDTQVNYMQNQQTTDKKSLTTNCKETTSEIKEFSTRATSTGNAKYSTKEIEETSSKVTMRKKPANHNANNNEMKRWSIARCEDLTRTQETALQGIEKVVEEEEQAPKVVLRNKAANSSDNSTNNDMKRWTITGLDDLTNRDSTNSKTRTRRNSAVFLKEIEEIAKIYSNENRRFSFSSSSSSLVDWEKTELISSFILKNPLQNKEKKDEKPAKTWWKRSDAVPDNAENCEGEAIKRTDQESTEKIGNAASSSFSNKKHRTETAETETSTAAHVSRNKASKNGSIVSCTEHKTLVTSSSQKEASNDHESVVSSTKTKTETKTKTSSNSCGNTLCNGYEVSSTKMATATSTATAAASTNSVASPKSVASSNSSSGISVEKAASASIEKKGWQEIKKTTEIETFKETTTSIEVKTSKMGNRGAFTLGFTDVKKVEEKQSEKESNEGELKGETEDEAETSVNTKEIEKSTNISAEDKVCKVNTEAVEAADNEDEEDANSEDSEDWWGIINKDKDEFTSYKKTSTSYRSAFVSEETHETVAEGDEIEDDDKVQPGKDQSDDEKKPAEPDPPQENNDDEEEEGKEADQDKDVNTEEAEAEVVEGTEARSASSRRSSSVVSTASHRQNENEDEDDLFSSSSSSSSASSSSGDSSDEDDDETHNVQQELESNDVNNNAEAPQSIKDRIEALRESIKEKKGQFKDENDDEGEIEIKVSVKDKINAIETGTKNISNKSSVKSFEEYSEEEGDSGVTSDMSRHISDNEEFPELKKMTRYQRASTHSRLFKLLQEECDDVDECEEETDNTPKTNRNEDDKFGKLSVRQKNQLSLPLQPVSNPESFSSSARTSPLSSPVNEKLVTELVQSMLKRKKGQIFRNVPKEKLQAAAKRILLEEKEIDDTSTPDSSFLSPLRNNTESSTPAQTPQEYYNDYKQYYDTWGDRLTEEGYDILPSKVFKHLQEHSGKAGSISGFLARCPKVEKTLRAPSQPSPHPPEPDEVSSAS